MTERQQKVLELLDQHGEALHRLLARLTRCDHTTRDLMQELFIHLSCSGAFDKAKNPHAYAWKAAVHLAFQWRRRKKPVSLPESFPLEDPYAGADEQRMIQEEQLQRVLDITASFKELARQVIVMRFIEQHSYEEMADRLGKKPDYLRALCSKSLTRLRTILKQPSEEHPDREVCHE